MMVRVLAFVRHAHPALEFTRGLSATDEPDLWRKDLTGNIELWIEVGQPDEKRLRKAGNRAARVCVYTYGGRGAELWWEQNRDALARLDNLTVVNLSYPATPGIPLTIPPRVFLTRTATTNYTSTVYGTALPGTLNATNNRHPVGLGR